MILDDLPSNVAPTLISQYANSPTIRRMVAVLGDYFDINSSLIATFYRDVFNLATASGWGLDVWGRILNFPRQLNAPGATPIFGDRASTVTSPADYAAWAAGIQSQPSQDFMPFNVAPMSDGGTATAVYTLPDDVYRRLLQIRARALICDCSIASINVLLRLFAGSNGRAYVTSNGNETCTYRFEWVLSALEYAVLTQTDLIPQPAGVTVTILGN